LRASWETYVSGPRWRLPEGSIRRAVIDSGLQTVDLLYEQRVTSLMQASIFFKITGEDDEVREFREMIDSAVRIANGP
jgi:hypothetical protein